MERKEKIQIVVIGGIVLGTALFLQLRGSTGEQEGGWLTRPEGGTKRQTVSLSKDGAEELFTFELRARERTAGNRRGVYRNPAAHQRGNQPGGQGKTSVDGVVGTAAVCGGDGSRHPVGKL